jgi:MFS family permease
MFCLPEDVRQYHLSVGWAYGFLGIIMGSYISRLPDLKDDFHLSNTLLGVILISAAVGAITAMPLILYLNKIYGSAITLLIGSLWVATIFPLIGIQGYHFITLAISFYFIGCGMAMIDVSMTSQVVIIEKKYQVNQMGIYGGTMAFGNFMGVLLGGGFAALDFSIRNHFLLMSLASLPFILLSYCYLFSKDEENSFVDQEVNPQAPMPLPSEHPGLLLQQGSFDSSILPLINPSLDQSLATSETFSENDNKQSKWRGDKNSYPPESQRILIYLCAVGFLNQVCCGSISDWSVVYYHENLDASPLERSFGFAMFALSSAVGSVYSDTICKYYSRKFILTMSGICGMIGIGFVYAAQWIPFPIYVASFGLLVSGFGLSSIGPVIASSGGDIPSIRPSDAVSYIAAVTYLGYLLGPPFFGTIADLLHGVQWGYLFIIGFIFLMILFPGNPPVNKYLKIYYQKQFSYNQMIENDPSEGEEDNNDDDGNHESQLLSSDTFHTAESDDDDEEYGNDDDGDDDEDQRTEDFVNSLERLSYPVF